MARHVSNSNHTRIPALLDDEPSTLNCLPFRPFVGGNLQLYLGIEQARLQLQPNKKNNTRYLNLNAMRRMEDFVAWTNRKGGMQARSDSLQRVGIRQVV